MPRFKAIEPATLTMLSTHSDDASASLSRLLGTILICVSRCSCSGSVKATGRQCLVSCNLPIKSDDILRAWQPFLRQHLQELGLSAQ